MTEDMQEAYSFYVTHLESLQKRLWDAPDIPDWIRRHVDECLEIVEAAEGK